MTGLEIVKHMRRFVDDDVAVRVFGLVGGSPHVRELARDAVVRHLDSLWFETVIVETNPKNPLPSRISPDVAARQFGVQRCCGSLKI
jgi:hypothetical protein